MAGGRAKKEPAVDRQRTGSLWGGIGCGVLFVIHVSKVPRRGRNARIFLKEGLVGGFDDECDRPLIHRGHPHCGPKHTISDRDSIFGMNGLAQGEIERLGELRRGCSDETWPMALGAVAREGELANQEHLAVLVEQ